MNGKPSRPRSLDGSALVVVPISLALGIAGAIAGNWLVVTVMVLVLIVQAVNFELRRRRLSRRDRT